MQCVMRGMTYSDGLDLVGEDDGHSDGVLCRDGLTDERVEASGVAVDEDGGDVVDVEHGLLGATSGPLRLFVSNDKAAIGVCLCQGERRETTV